VKGVLQIILTINLLLVFSIEIPKRAFRFYEKGEIEKTVDALDKSLAKSENNPGAKYLYAILHVDTAFWGYHVDSAYNYINAAIKDYETVTEPKDIASLTELGVDSVSMEILKNKIDSLSFALILSKHTIKTYEWFMTTHKDAVQIPKAINLRNHIFFEQKEYINTHESYWSYMTTYPNGEDFDEAEKRYKKLLYEDRTADNSLKSHADFLEEYPGTPYRAASEDRIFEISTTLNSIQVYTDFLKKYPNPKFKDIIIPRLYHIVKDKYGSDYFQNYFEFLPVSDSLKNVIALEQGVWMPKLEDDAYSFMLPSGEVKLTTNLTEIPEAYLCSTIETDFVFGENQIIGRNGNTIYSGPLILAEDIGFGYIKVLKEEGYILIHKSGEIIISEAAEDFGTLSERFIKIKKNGLWGLTTIHGYDILDTEFSSIDTLANFLLIEKDERIAISTNQYLASGLAEPLIFDFKYDEIEPLENGLFLVFNGNTESIIDKDERVILAPTTSSINDREYGWLLKGESSIQLLHDDYISLQDSVYDGIVENDNWIGLKRGEKWTLLDQHGRLFPVYDYDSLQFWGENMVMLTKGDSLYAQFKNGEQMLMEDGWTAKLLVPQTYTKTGEKAESDFFMLSNAKKFRKVYNNYGKEILAATYDEVTALGPNLIKLQKKNAALVDSTGAFVLNFIYDGIGSYDNGYVSILKGDKVGVINLDKAINIAPAYSSRIQAYSDTVLIATEDGLKGFINTKDELLSGFDFDEIKYWNDTIALTRIEDEWLLHQISDETVIYEGILSYEFLKESEEENIIQVTTANGKGIYSSLHGEIIEPTFTEIIRLGTGKNPVYFAQKYVKEADLHIVIYHDKDGNKLFTQTFQEDEYYKIACSK
jgi:tetratricopeptide (TPR) repeat protein